MSTFLAVENIQCHHKNHRVIDGLSFHVNQGEIVCLLGASGCGKTTTLRAIAGLEKIDDGQIHLQNRLLSAKNVHVSPQQRHIGMVFQENTLFPHLSVRDNIAFGVWKLKKKQQQKIVDELLQLIQLEAHAEKFPHQLSGGQQQRVALARALAPTPTLLLLDEPFSNLDIDLRRQLHTQVKDLLQNKGITTILVTHEHREAFGMANQIGIMHQGKIEQWDTPFNLYHKPKNRYIANFIGVGHFIAGEMFSETTVKTAFGNFTGTDCFSWPEGTRVDVLIRPDDISFQGNAKINARIVRKNLFGATTLYTLELPTQDIVEAIFPSHADFDIDAMIPIAINIDHLVLFLANR